MADIIRCVAIDDEPLALDVIRQFCHRLGGIELTTFSDPVEGMEYINGNKTDIVFLDIEMGEVNVHIPGEARSRFPVISVHCRG